MTDDKKYTTTVKLKTGAPAYETVSPVPPEDGPSATSQRASRRAMLQGSISVRGPSAFIGARGANGEGSRMRSSGWALTAGPCSETLQRDLAADKEEKLGAIGLLRRRRGIRGIGRGVGAAVFGGGRPRIFSYAGLAVRPAGKHEEKIREPIQVDDGLVVHGS